MSLIALNNLERLLSVKLSSWMLCMLSDFAQQTIMIIQNDIIVANKEIEYGGDSLLQ